MSVSVQLKPSKPVIMLTGAASGIGRATALLLGEKGYRLGLIDRDAAPLDEVASELRRKGVAVTVAAADVRDGERLRAAVSDIETTLGPIDIVVACAGVGGIASVVNMDLPALKQMLEINVLGVAQTIEAVLPGMFARKSGLIVGISSVAGYRGLPWMPGYSASKAALTTYLEALRPALKLRGVGVTTVYPGFVNTGMTVSTPFKKPIPMLEPSQAAWYVVRAIEKRPRDYTFPLSAKLGMGLLRRLPNRLFDYCMDQAGPRALTSEF